MVYKFNNGTYPYRISKHALGITHVKNHKIHHAKFLINAESSFKLKKKKKQKKQKQKQKQNKTDRAHKRYSGIRMATVP